MPKDWGDKPQNPSPEPEGARKSRWNTTLFLTKEIKEKYGKKPRNPSWNKKGGGNHDGAECHNIREISPHRTECEKTRETTPRTLPGTRKWRWNRMPEGQGENSRNRTQNFFFASAFRPVWPGRCIVLSLSLCTTSDSRPGPGGSRAAAGCQRQAWKPSAIPLHHSAGSRNPTQKQKN